MGPVHGERGEVEDGVAQRVVLGPAVPVKDLEGQVLFGMVQLLAGADALSTVGEVREVAEAVSPMSDPTWTQWLNARREATASRLSDTQLDWPEAIAELAEYLGETIPK